MAGRDSFFIVSYDIPNDRRRTKIATLLLGYGLRVQESVYECVLDSAQFSQLQQRLRPLIRPATDAVRIYRLCKVCEGRTEVLGGEAPHRHDVYIL
jgi:CRISPR-associated protein Cas2